MKKPSLSTLLTQRLASAIKSTTTTRRTVNRAVKKAA